MKQFQRYVVFVAALLLIATTAFAQGTTSAMTGTVTMEGNPLPGVTVTISSPAMQGTRTTVTDVNGNYNFGAIAPGAYTVKFEMESMQTITKQVSVTLAGTARSNADMKLSAVAEAITVTASAPAVLETTEVQTNVQATLVQDLPMSRTFQSTANLAPGVTTNSPSGGQLVISGAPASESLYLVNGAVVNENVRSQIHNLFIEDAIQEQTVLTGSISAEYGRFTGGVVSAITKSGGNEFSGSLRDNLNNDSWRANTPLEDAQGIDHPDDIQEVYEATLGGRIVRDRLWFFLAGRYFDTKSQRFLQSLGDEQLPYTYGQKNERYEIKLTGQVTPKHSLVGSYLTNDTKETNYCFTPCIDYLSIDDARQTPNKFETAHYNGILTSSFLLEAGYSHKTFTFEDSGGQFGDFVHGTWGYDLNGNGFFNAPVFCGFCDPEARDNRNYNVKATYYLATKAIGTHNLVAGYDDFAEQRKANNYQSGSNFEVYVFNSPERGPNGTTLPVFAEGDFIQWTPILELSKGSNLITRSFFLNDKVDFNTHFNFNIGARYDGNDVTDSAGHKTSDDSAISPRLGVTYDFLGDGRYRINAGYNKYVSHIQETIGGSGASPAGNPAYFDYYYLGPTISGVSSEQAFTQLWDWFQAQGGTDATDLIFAAAVPGVNTVIRGSLTSPNVTEYTIGFGTQLGQSAFGRFDYIDRDFSDFYQTRTDMTTGQVVDPFGSDVDLGIIENGKNLNRTYKALILQAGWRATQKFNLGGNWTYSETKGNFLGETGGSGPITDASASYPEYKAFAQNSPVGYLSNDQKHKGRLWATYDLPTPIGRFTFGALESYDTGTPYSAIGTVRPGPWGFVENPGYANPVVNVNYYFSDRGQYRWDTATATDLSLTYEFPIKKVSLWAKGDVLNTFNEDAVVGGNVTVLTNTSGSCVQTTGANVGARCAIFNPFTETPVQGVNYQLGSSFGKPTSNLNYQTPRTYRFSLGVRF